ncbi:MAG: non-canonical purine NTP pyrophosphatase, RdgB/HAM1 family [Spirochaetes bacterium GWD1_27_9]|nr:MAG: non-canonical purine NTP pyrophosphatase, RdgB/HAM1 family [Spirochaetes bacterium GWB1_27_13]OHD20586.1 MAG: non-canonical purine NTP pyrophosphatase, RdgB/HAM1 family [Spirochaetes bacterium GWC1_27_15]OHD41261.1 MAG: non-canonical purine NTP pyrophosphatase, RdgB/HAM1 family [Spirochaetes bacterium GWD1_27_9]
MNNLNITLATFNNHKAAEFKEIFGDLVELKTLKDINFTDEIIEDGLTFIENSLIKCRAVYDKIKSPVLADDSGLCVEALNGEPGLFSARYGGKGLTDKQRYELLLQNLKGQTNLNAAFVCALVLFINPNRIYVVQEEVKGLITFNPRGDNGFGYDPVFYLEQFDKTVAQLTSEQKHSISHRGKAASLMKKIMENL